ncbi:hypothetical protein [Bartonella rattaustraliani]|uniref:hypothetical protein n=1 Tax=Bartonella rattaustraliani TaxID=481139 RepID=UPI00035F52BF|nr:hypothetical protein [Bartonella rattaustraliani]
MGWCFRAVLGGTRFVGETVKGGGGACGTVCGEAPCEWRVMKYRQQACALGRRFWAMSGGMYFGEVVKG